MDSSLSRLRALRNVQVMAVMMRARMTIATIVKTAPERALFCRKVSLWAGAGVLLVVAVGDAVDVWVVIAVDGTNTGVGVGEVVTIVVVVDVCSDVERVEVDVDVALRETSNIEDVKIDGMFQKDPQRS
jgi:hypothetical protein